MRPHLAYESNRTPSRRHQVDAIDVVSPEDQSLAAINNGRQSPKINQAIHKPQVEVKQAESEIEITQLEAELQKLKQMIQNSDLNHSVVLPPKSANQSNVCFKCKQPGHYAADCTQAGIVCYGCDTPGFTKPK